MNTHIVIKSFTGPGNTVFQVGQRVDATEWRHADRLVSQRYLRSLETPPERKGNRIQQAAHAAREVQE